MKKLTDSEIKKAIQAKLNKENLWDKTGIHVQVVNGNIMLTGTVPDKEARNKTKELIQSVDGVKEVSNALKVKGDGVASMVSKIGSEMSK